MKNVWTGMLVLLAACLSAVPAGAQVAEPGVKHTPTAAYRWVDVLLEAAADDVERVGARPTVLSRQMAIPLTAAFDAWAAYDEKAVGTTFGDKLRRPASERTQENKETAIAYAMYRCLVDQLPFQKDDITAEMVKMGYDPNNDSMDVTTAAGIGNRVAAELLKRRHHDGANQLGDEAGGKPGEAYGDYTMYRCVNPNDRIVDPDRWQRLPFADGKGGHVYPDFLTPHWYRVKPFALESSDQFRAPPVPLVGSEELKKQVDECIEFNANLTVERKAIVEFMRDGPRSTGQSGHWLRFAQAVSRRDKLGLDEDVKLFFVVSNTAMDAFISAWESKRYYDSSRPWTLVRHYYSDTMIRGWAGPGEGVKEIPGSQWHPYSPDSFVTPPFPAYVSGHSTVSGACATMLKLFTGSDRFDAVENRKAGALTEAEHSCLEIQKVDGKLPQLKAGETMTCDVSLPMPTFWAVAEMAGISRVMGGYHIQADNIEGLNMGRKVADYSWPKYQAYFNGTAKVQGDDST